VAPAWLWKQLLLFGWLLLHVLQQGQVIEKLCNMLGVRMLMQAGSVRT
jgi:hypothetical protein